MNPKVLLCGAGITRDDKIQKLLRKKFTLSILQDSEKLQTFVSEHHIDLVILEPSDAWEEELRRMQSLKTSVPQIIIVIVNGGDSTKAVIRAFKNGADDYFKKPYDSFLLAERVEALLKRKSRK